MKRKVILTCAVTGGIVLGKNTQYVPITPTQIADEALASADAGASSVHIHVRDPETGAPSMELDHYRAVVERIRENNTNVIINLTAGMGANYAPPLEEGQEATRVVETPLARTIHVTEPKLKLLLICPICHEAAGCKCFQSFLAGSNWAVVFEFISLFQYPTNARLRIAEARRWNF